MSETNGTIEAPAEFFQLNLEVGDETAFKGTLGIGDNFILAYRPERKTRKRVKFVFDERSLESTEQLIAQGRMSPEAVIVANAIGGGVHRP